MVNETSGGTVMVGAVVSCTVILWVSVAELLEELVTVQVTVVSPTGNDCGASFCVVMLVSAVRGDSGSYIHSGTRSGSLRRDIIWRGDCRCYDWFWHLEDFDVIDVYHFIICVQVYGEPYAKVSQVCIVRQGIRL